MVACYSYHSRSANLAEAARGLTRFLNAVAAETIHLVGRSMGGLVILQMLNDTPRSDIGRIVLLGTPYRDSTALKRY